MNTPNPVAEAIAEASGTAMRVRLLLRVIEDYFVFAPRRFKKDYRSAMAELWPLLDKLYPLVVAMDRKVEKSFKKPKARTRRDGE